jgi:hypothetical protein
MAKDIFCLGALLVADSETEWRCIEDIKGGLLHGLFCWILDNPEF